jgi:hypothetical protein
MFGRRGSETGIDDLLLCTKIIFIGGLQVPASPEFSEALVVLNKPDVFSMVDETSAASVSPEELNTPLSPLLPPSGMYPAVKPFLLEILQPLGELNSSTVQPRRHPML